MGYRLCTTTQLENVILSPEVSSVIKLDNWIKEDWIMEFLIYKADGARIICINIFTFFILVEYILNLHINLHLLPSVLLQF